MTRLTDQKIKRASAHKLAWLAGYRRALLHWYDAHKRTLPWREEKDPYKIWVSEVMLQQTRVAVVSERYKRFLQRFPTVQVLARARVASVLAEWSGLGYYRRARALHAAAAVVVREHSGKMPQSVEGLRDLPGIGRYTASAIASIAFGEAVAVVDGNVERVLQRFYGENTLGDLKHYYQCAEELLDRNRPGDFNQAMMELGATVCLPKTPLCRECPIARLCRGKKQFTGPRNRPSFNLGESRRKVRAAYRVSVRRNRVCLVQRPPDATLMPSMWELPQHDGKVARSAQSVRLRHSITNTDFEIIATLEAEPESKLVQRGMEISVARWVEMRRLNQLPLTGLARKILRRFALLD